MELNQPKHIISLATSSVIVSADVSVWSATKQDREISHEVTTAKKADQNAGRFVKSLLAGDVSHKNLLNYRQTVYNWLRRSTFDWNGSNRLLPVINLPKFKSEFHEHEKAFFALRDIFLDKYPNIVSDMAFKQGDMFTREEYPSVDQIRNKFTIRLFVNEVPTNDHRCNIAQDLADDLKVHYEQQAESIVKGVADESLLRLAEVMQSISHCCGVDVIGTSPDGEEKTKKRKIYEATIQKARDYCETFQAFNLTNSALLLEASVSLEKALNGISAEDIRESDAVRTHVKDEVDSILSKFGSFSI
jgi:hypothetical protein